MMVWLSKEISRTSRLGVCKKGFGGWSEEVLQTIVYRLFNEQLDPVPMPKGYGMEISPHLCRQVVPLEDGFSCNCCIDPCIVLNTIVSTQARAGLKIIVFFPPLSFSLFCVITPELILIKLILFLTMLLKWSNEKMDKNVFNNSFHSCPCS